MNEEPQPQNIPLEAPPQQEAAPYGGVQDVPILDSPRTAIEYIATVIEPSENLGDISSYFSKEDVLGNISEKEMKSIVEDATLAHDIELFNPGCRKSITTFQFQVKATLIFSRSKGGFQQAVVGNPTKTFTVRNEQVSPQSGGFKRYLRW